VLKSKLRIDTDPKKSSQTWDLSKSLHRRIFLPKISHNFT